MRLRWVSLLASVLTARLSRACRLYASVRFAVPLGCLAAAGWQDQNRIGFLLTR